MPSIKDDPGGGTSDPNLTIYPIDSIREVAARILVQADQALQQHTTTWSGIQAWFNENDDSGYMASVLNPHEKRMRDLYNWQMQLASTLFAALDLIEANENDIRQSLTPREHGAF